MIIAAVDRTIRRLLAAEVDQIGQGQIDVKFDQPNREWSSHLSRPTVNLFLYDLRENHVLRQHQWQQVAPGTNGFRQAQSRQKRTPFRVDCTYMMTAWANDPEDEHRLLAQCMLALFRHPTLPDDFLDEETRRQPFELTAHLASHDRLTNPAEIWSALDNELRPSVPYIVTIAMDPWTDEDVKTDARVRTLTLQARGREIWNNAAGPFLDSEHHWIGGAVAREDKPVADMTVAIKGTGLFTRTDRNGRFRLGPLLTGQYTLVAWIEDSQVVEKPVIIPPDGGEGDALENEMADYNIDL